MGKLETLNRRVEEGEKAVNNTLTKFMGLYTCNIYFLLQLADCYFFTIETLLRLLLLKLSDPHGQFIMHVKFTIWLLIIF